MYTHLQVALVTAGAAELTRAYVDKTLQKAIDIAKKKLEQRDSSFKAAQDLLNDLADAEVAARPRGPDALGANQLPSINIELA